jgi:hypothetical protein
MRKHLQYLRYLARHKYFVFYAGVKWTKAPLWRLIIHDWSKFMPCEWLPYAEYFYGKGPRNIRDGIKFDVAWLHHQHHNPHHWQHWILREDTGDTKYLEMPNHFVREMVADWMGAGRAITGKWAAKDWYEKNKANILLHKDTREYVEMLLGYPLRCSACDAEYSPMHWVSRDGRTLDMFSCPTIGCKYNVGEILTRMERVRGTVFSGSV